MSGDFENKLTGDLIEDEVAEVDVEINKVTAPFVAQTLTETPQVKRAMFLSNFQEVVDTAVEQIVGYIRKRVFVEPDETVMRNITNQVVQTLLLTEDSRIAEGVLHLKTLQEVMTTVEYNIGLFNFVTNSADVLSKERADLPILQDLFEPYVLADYAERIIFTSGMF